jgi:hypothetical protein
MANSDFQRLHATIGLAPVADAFSGTVYSDIVSLSKHNECLFTIIKGVGATGTSTITVEGSDNFSGSAVAAVPFLYRVSTTPDAWGDWTQATAAGFATTAGSAQLYQIAVRGQDLPAGKPNARLKAVEVVDSPVLGGILIQLGQPKYGGEAPATAIA